MNSALITMLTGSYRGGIGRSVTNLSNALVRSGYRVDILVDRPDFPYAEELTGSVGLRYLRTSHRIGGVLHLLKYLKERKPVVVLTPFVQLTLLAVRTRSLFRVPMKIYTNVHSTYSVDFAGLDPGKRKRRISDMKRYYTRCDGIIAVSDGVAADFSNLTGIPEGKIQTIHNPIVTDEMIQSSGKRPDHPWFLADQPPVLLGMGRLIDSKNFDELIQAFVNVRRERACRLVLLGDGPARSDLELLANTSPSAEDILFLGHQENPFPYLRYSSLFVLSSSYEGLPSSLIESMAVGTPVVSTDCPHGPREILEGGRFGELVPVNDPDTLSDAIIRTLENPPDSLTLRTAAERFRDMHIARSYVSAFGLSHLS